MLKINLASRKKSSGSGKSFGGGGGGASGGGGFDGGGGGGLFRMDASELKNLPIWKPILVVIVCFLGSEYADEAKQKEVDRFDQKIAKLQTRQGNLQRELVKTRGYEGIKKQLEKDEFTLKTKIETIKKLMNGRRNVQKMLMAISDVIPEKVWLEKFSFKNDQAVFLGGAADFNLISDFMKRLGGTAYFENLSLKNSRRKKLKNGALVASFEVGADLK